MSYPRQHTFGAVIGGTFDLYLRYFPVVFFTYAIPYLVAMALIVGAVISLMPSGMGVIMAAMAQQRGQGGPMTPEDAEALMSAMPFGTGAELSVASVAMFAALFVGAMVFAMGAFSAATLVVSELCRGNRPAMGQALRQGFQPGLLGRMFATGLLVGFGALVCFIPVVVVLHMGMLPAALGPLLFLALGIAFFVLTMFVGTVVVLEGEWGIGALRRSIELGRGHYLRNVGVWIVTFLVIMLAMLGVGIGLGILSATGMISELVIGLVQGISQMVLAPIYLVLMVVLYYDMKGRIEPPAPTPAFPGSSDPPAGGPSGDAPGGGPGMSGGGFGSGGTHMVTGRQG